MGLENCRQVSSLKPSLSTMGIRVRWEGAILYTHYNYHEPERTGSLKIRKVWLLGSDVMGLQVSRHRI